jgi:hypothetical protein
VAVDRRRHSQPSANGRSRPREHRNLGRSSHAL